ncbi:hypothetical protein MACH16_27270 [Marinomonas pontica]|uniref:Transposase (putative) YhgA-like domain-containing protein n=1 Tax=Marinomonas pontica TaxID=264739 RepID=A0ABM8FHV1_9GAMM|nr:hypothetical protein MACH16_27270 [Marinomonas pontica]
MNARSVDDHDSPWKEALEQRFPEFLALLFPDVYEQVDWSQGREFLDKELQQVVQDAELGRRYADKLVKVFARDGSETLPLIRPLSDGCGQFRRPRRYQSELSTQKLSLGTLGLRARFSFPPSQAPGLARSLSAVRTQ